MKKVDILRFLRNRTWWRGFQSPYSSRSLHVCVVGSGPAGFYTTEKILKAHEEAKIDVVDRLPTPFGLVRSGVAPDHPETKVVINQFSRVASNERCSFFGNVSLGRDVSLSELRGMYDVVVLAYGAESDQNLNISGEALAGIHSAREFVWWYNGHPDYSSMVPNLDNTDTAIILGQGNVALDVARILLRPASELATTDIADHALDALYKSSIRRVYLVGRRGPVQASCTAKELRGILGINNLNIYIKESDLLKSPADEEEVRNSRIRKRVHELLSKAATSCKHDSMSSRRELHFIFFRRPDKFLCSIDNNKVRGVSFEKTYLTVNNESGKQYAVGTGQFEDLEAGLILKSIGYKSVPVEGLPFDECRGLVPNIKGRVLKNNSECPILENGLYVAGWLKRGPTGIIATNVYCAEETVESMLEDLGKGVLTPNANSSKRGRQGLHQVLEDRGIRYVNFHGWEKIDLKEQNEGKSRNKPRSKITDWYELLRVANG